MAGERHEGCVDTGGCCAFWIGSLTFALEVKLGGDRKKLVERHDAELGKLERDFAKDLQALAEKHLAAVTKLRSDRQKDARKQRIKATKKGDLKLALEWQAIEDRLSNKPRNLAQGARIEFNAERANHRAAPAVDGKHSTGPWWGRTNPSWLRVHLGGASMVKQVRMLVRHSGGVPRDFEIRFQFQGINLRKVDVKNGKHAFVKNVRVGKTHQWIECTLPKPVFAPEVELYCKTISGSVMGIDEGALVTELEVLGLPLSSKLGE